MAANCNVDCNVGNITGELCHSTKYIRKKGLIQISDLDDESLNLLQIRVGSEIDRNGTVCFHHEKAYLTKYEDTQRYCCDPFKLHKKMINSKYSLLLFQYHGD